MPRLATALWIINIFLDTAGHLSFKAAANAKAAGERRSWMTMLRSVYLWTGLACFGLEFVVWFALLSLIPLSQAVLIGSINIVVLMIAGRLLFGERLDRLRVGGMILIAAGVALAGGGI
ncbi:MAG TPA: EamA family transporter [Thermoanaerobaculia bacterium]|jgi:drug/metabolite transporter (DMT)-like permease|nr:EamA family transporter [Thermoanaerobaculia bacterium]